jgi:DNA helicase-2/ATP-dependent DNA helicase PcrA
MNDWFAGPDALGRNLVLRPGQAAPAPWTDVERLPVGGDGATPLPVLFDRWHRRQRTVFEVPESAEHLDAQAIGGPAWSHDATRLVEPDLVHHLVWRNSVDGRVPDSPCWAWAEAAIAAGAAPSTRADVALRDGTPAWCDGGPLSLVDAGGVPVLHRIALERGELVPLGSNRSTADLAPDQLAAVLHMGGAARIIAPAGSGKTRVLTERARHLLRTWRVPASAVTLVAFNERAAAEMRDRTTDLRGLQVRTLNALGLAVLDGRPPFAPRHGPHEVLDERATRQILSGLIDVPKRLNTDPLAPWLDALAEVRLGLRPPGAVEASYDGDVDGLAPVLDRYRAIMKDRHAVDFNEQIATAIEVLLGEPDVRAVAQRACRVMLVDEFQDLAPAHLLLVRLMASPDLAVFGVGDDDQTIYGYAGATPQWLIGYADLFPGAGDHPLEVNYRCPPAVVRAAAMMLAHNRRRVAKVIRPQPGRGDRPDDLRVVAADDTLAAVADAVEAALGAGAAPSDVVVLTRVNATLVGPQLALRHRDVPVERAIDERWLERTGVRAALAWLRLATRPTQLDAADVREAARRPARGRSAKLVDWMTEQRSTAALQRLAGRLAARDADKVEQFIVDLERLVRIGARSDAGAVLRAIRNYGLDDSMAALDGFQHTPKQSGHLDDLDALIAVAPLCPEPARFPSWLRTELGRGGSETGVRLATVHRVKGREWPHVVVHHAGADQFPHRLAEDVEEERRVFHVAITRCSTSCTIVAPAANRSPFVAEILDEPAPAPIGRRQKPSPPSAPTAAQTPADSSVVDALKAWRRERAKADGVPAYVVLHDSTLAEIAARAPGSLFELGRIKGMGPTKLERYGDEILAVLM